jgi:hypothetical protein
MVLQHGPSALRVAPQRAVLPRMQTLSSDECYLFDTEEGRKYVCTENPEELAWHMGLEIKDLVTGVKPDDLNLIECAEEWSHTGTPQWTCREETKQEKDEGCELIGETVDELWFACGDSESARPAGVSCEEVRRRNARCCRLPT